MPPPEKYPGDQYIKDMVNEMGFIKPDVNGNYVLYPEDVALDTKSVGNVILAHGARVVNSHNNILNAAHIVIENASGCRADGADHTIKGNGTSGNYACIDGDANWSEGYCAKTSGYGNINCGEYGAINGNNNRIGLKGQPNKCSACSIQGNNNEIDTGDNSHAIGKFIKINGSNITVIGDNTPAPGEQPRVFTEPGVYILNQK